MFPYSQVVTRSGGLPPWSNTPKATTPLAPDGYVQVQGELWRALSTGANIEESEEIVAVEIRRLTLFVAPLSDSSREVGE